MNGMAELLCMENAVGKCSRKMQYRKNIAII